MIRLTYIVLFTFFALQTLAQTGIGTGDSPSASAELEVRSTTKGVLIPRLTETQRDNLTLTTPPAAGLMIYNLTDHNFNYFDGSAWISLPGALPTEIVDADGDTKVEVQRTAGDNQIRFDVEGTEVALLNNTALDIVNGRYLIKGEQLINAESKNLYAGKSAGMANVSGDSIVVIGENAMTASITGNANTAIGFEAGASITGGNSNLFIGHQSGKNTIGANSGEGEKNTFIGSLSGTANTSGSNNIYIGNNSGLQNNGNYNIFIGANSGSIAATAHNNIVIGQGLTLGNNVSDSLKIGSTISGNFEKKYIYFNNAYSFPATDGGADALMKLNDKNQLEWHDRVPDSVRANAADLQPSDYVAMNTVGDIGNLVYYMSVLSFAEAPITKITTYISSGGDGVPIYMGIYLKDGTRLGYGTKTLAAGTDSGFITADLDVTVNINKSQEYYLALYTNNSAVQFKTVDDPYNQSVTESHTGTEVPPAIIDFSTKVDKNVWLRAH